MNQIQLLDAGQPRLAVDSANYATITTGAMFDLQAQYGVYTRGFHDNLLSTIGSMETLLQLRAALNSIGWYMWQLRALIPDTSAEDGALADEMRTYLVVLDSGRRKMFDIVRLLYENVTGFAGRSEARSLGLELLQQTKLQFGLEEHLMADSAFDAAKTAVHAREHLLLRQRLTTLTDNVA
jgi:hypothetical protein